MLKRVAIGGGPVTALAPIEIPSSVSWETDDILLTLSNRIHAYPAERRRA